MKKIIVLFIMGINHCSGMDLPPKNKILSLNEQHIIFLNGTTTAGKSSIAEALKKQLEEQSLSVEICAIDSFLVPKVQWALAVNRLNPFNLFISNDQLITSEAMKEIRDESQQELCMAVKTAYAQKKVVIIDAPLYSTDQITFYQKEFEGLKTTWTLIYCPVSTLVKRVIKRNHESGITGQRSIAQALDQFQHLYSNNTDHSIDILLPHKLSLTCKDAAREHVLMQGKIPNFIKGIQNIICSFSIGDIEKFMVEKFKPFEDTGVINIAPDMQLGIPYSLIVNTKLNNPAVCAQKIIDIFHIK